MIKLKSPEEIKIMVEGGKIASTALQEGVSAVKVGVTTLDIERIIDAFIASKGAQASFRTVADYDFSSCININEGIVHGMPNIYALQKGDLVSIDLGVLFRGYHSDLSYTIEVATDNESQFLEIGKSALEKAISMCTTGKRLGDVSYAIQKEVESWGWGVSRDLVGHGIGRSLHEDPYVPCYGVPNTGIKLKEGMVLAVEVIYQKGKPDLKLKSDGWTLETVDKSLSALFEKTVAVTKNEPILITTF